MPCCHFYFLNPATIRRLQAEVAPPPKVDLTTTKKGGGRKFPSFDDGQMAIAPVVDPSSVKFTVHPAGFDTLPDIPCIEVIKPRPLKVGEKRALLHQLEVSPCSSLYFLKTNKTCISDDK